MQSSGKQARKDADRQQGREQEPEEIILSSLFFTHPKALSSHPSGAPSDNQAPYGYALTPKSCQQDAKSWSWTIPEQEIPG